MYAAVNLIWPTTPNGIEGRHHLSGLLGMAAEPRSGCVRGGNAQLHAKHPTCWHHSAAHSLPEVLIIPSARSIGPAEMGVGGRA